MTCQSALFAALGIASLNFISNVLADEVPGLAAPAISQNVPVPNGFDQKFRVEGGTQEARQMLNAMAARTGKTVLIADGVMGRVMVQAREMTITEFLNQLARAANFSWGRIGNDTILITPNLVQQTPVVRPAPSFQFERGTRTPVQPDWKPFQFNGGTYYHIPLQSEANGQNAAPVSPTPHK
jgi:hypothetical protein